MAENVNSTEAIVATQNEKESSTEMVKHKVNLAGLLAILSFILTLPILASIIWLLYVRDFECENVLRLPKLQVGVCIALIFVFLISNTVTFLRSRFPVPGLLLVMVPLIVMLTMGLTFVGAYKMESRTIPASPTWFKVKVHNTHNWNNIKSCIFDNGVCDDLVSRSLTLKSYVFNTRKLSFIESGCCKPPSTCEMEYVNATFWKKNDGATEKSYPENEDCNSWKNDREILCYNCNTCKEGFLAALESKWWKLGIFLVLMALLIIVAHLLLFLVTMWKRYLVG